MNATLIRGMTELVTFRINRKYKKEIENYALMAEENSQNITKMTMIHEFSLAFCLVSRTYQSKHCRT